MARKRRKTSFTKADARDCASKTRSMREYGRCMGAKVRARARKGRKGKRRK